MGSRGDEVVFEAVKLALLLVGALQLDVGAGVLDGLGGLGGEEIEQPEESSSLKTRRSASSSTSRTPTTWP